jgi:ATP-dependent Clp protease ATP-binding subunit ClpA
MLERLSEQAHRVMILADEEATMLNPAPVTTEHIVLGLIDEHDGLAVQALESLGINLETLRRRAEKSIIRSQQTASAQTPPSSASPGILLLAMQEATQLGHARTGTEHILLALMREENTPAAQALTKLGANQAKIRQRITELLDERDSQPAAPRRRPRISKPQATTKDSNVPSALAAIADRLTAIEQHLRIPSPPLPSGSGKRTAKATDNSAPAAHPDTAQLRTEVTRLENLLRQHGIDPSTGQANAAPPE